MAKNNKYTSFNFNDLYDKKNATSTTTSAAGTTASRSPSSSLSAAHPNKSYSLSASSRLGHGGMLVLSRPSPKPLPSPPLSPSPRPTTPPSSSGSDPKPPGSDPISLRPQGKIGSGLSPFPSFERVNKEAPSLSSKSDKFVPPHLRPGFVAREQNPVSPELERARNGNFRNGLGHGSSNRYVEDGRPKSGNGYDRRMRGSGGGGGGGGGESNLGELIRPRSGGNRPSSSG